MVADESIWAKKNTELENKVFVFILVDDDNTRELKKESVQDFIEFYGDVIMNTPINVLKPKTPLLENFDTLPENVFSYLVDVNLLYSLFRS